MCPVDGELLLCSEAGSLYNLHTLWSVEDIKASKFRFAREKTNLPYMFSGFTCTYTVFVASLIFVSHVVKKCAVLIRKVNLVQ